MLLRMHAVFVVNFQLFLSSCDRTQVEVGLRMIRTPQGQNSTGEVITQGWRDHTVPAADRRQQRESEIRCIMHKNLMTVNHDA